MTTQLFEFSDVKEILGLDKTEMTDYPDLQIIADLVTARIEGYLGKEFEEEQRTISLYQEERTTMVALVGLPVKSVSVLTVNGSAVTGYRLTKYGILLPYQISNSDLVCTYIGGLPDIPEWLRRAAVIQTIYEYQNKDHMGADYVATEGGSVGRPALTLLTDVKKTLDIHVHPLNRFY